MLRVTKIELEFLITVWSIFHAKWYSFYLKWFCITRSCCFWSDEMWFCYLAVIDAYDWGFEWEEETKSSRLIPSGEWESRKEDRQNLLCNTLSAFLCLWNSSSKIERVLLGKLDEGMCWVILDRPAASGLRNWQKCIRAPAGSGGAGGRRERETHWQTAGGNETRHSYHRARERKPKIKSGKITFWYTSSSSN